MAATGVQDAFSPAMNARAEALIAHVQPSWESERRRGAVGHYMNSIIAHTFNGQVATCAFGSVPLKTCLPDGDIDLSIFTAEALRDSWAVALQARLEAEGRRHDAPFAVTEVQVINAEVRLLKCLVDNIVVDVSFNQLGGLCTLAFLESVDRLVGRTHLFKRSIILVKAWCYYESRLLGAHHGLISTYALETLVLYIFNTQHRTLEGPLDVLHRFVTEFCEFDWDRYCLSLQGPIALASFPDYKVEPPRQLLEDPLLTPAHVAHIRAHYHAGAAAPSGAEAKPFVTKCLNIQDALLPSNNLGRSVARCNLMRIRRAFAHGASALAGIKAKPNDTDALRALDAFFRNTWNANCPPPRGPPPPAAITANGGARRGPHQHQHHQHQHQHQQQQQQSFHSALGGLPPVSVSVPKFAPMSAPPSIACTPHGAAPPYPAYALPLPSPREQRQEKQQAGAADAESSGGAHSRGGPPTQAAAAGSAGEAVAAAAAASAAAAAAVLSAPAVERPCGAATATATSSAAPHAHAIPPPPPPPSACASSPAASTGQSPTGSSPAGGASPVGSLGVAPLASSAHVSLASPPGRPAVPVPGPLLTLDGAPNLAHPGIQTFIQEVLAAQMVQAQAQAQHAYAHAVHRSGGQHEAGAGATHAHAGLGRGGPHEAWQQPATQWERHEHALQIQEQLACLAYTAASGGGGDAIARGTGTPPPPLAGTSAAAAAAAAIGAAVAPFPPPLGEPSLLLGDALMGAPSQPGGGGGGGVTPAPDADAEGGGAGAVAGQQPQQAQHDMLASDWGLLSASLTRFTDMLQLA